MRKRTKRTIRNILLRKGSSMLIGFTVAALFGIPLHINLGISLCIVPISMLKDYFLDRYFNNELINDFKVKKAIEDNPELTEYGAKQLIQAKDDYLPGNIEPLNPDDELVKLEAKIYQALEKIQTGQDEVIVIYLDDEHEKQLH